MEPRIKGYTGIKCRINTLQVLINGRLRFGLKMTYTYAYSVLLIYPNIFVTLFFIEICFFEIFLCFPYFYLNIFVSFIFVIF